MRRPESGEFSPDEIAAALSFPGIVWLTDADLRVRAAFGGFFTQLGIRREQVMGTSVLEWYGTDEQAHPAVAAHRQALLGASSIYRVATLGRDMVVHVDPVVEGGVVVGVVGIATDPAETAEAFSASRRRDTQQAALAALGLAAVRSIDLDELFGVAVDALLAELDADGAAVVEARSDGETMLVRRGTADASVVLPLLYARHGTLAALALDDDGTVVTGDFGSDSRLAPAEHPFASGAAAPIRRRAGTFGVVVAFARERHAFSDSDVNFMRSVANVLSGTIEREEALALAAETVAAVPDALLIVDDDGIVVDANPAAERLLGRPRHDVLGMSVESASPDRPAARERLEAVLGGAELEGELLRPDGTRRTVVSSSAPTFRAGLHLVVCRDVTEQRKLERELRQAQKMEAVGTLTAGIAHDFNNLLVVVRGLSELVLKELDPGSGLREDVEAIHAAGVRGIASVDRLLAFARPPDAADARVVRAADAVKSAQALLRQVVRADVELTVVEHSEAAVLVAPADLEQALLNLVVNAQDAISGSGTIRIEIDEQAVSVAEARSVGVVPGRFVCIAVVDDGAGMDEETRDRVTEPFYTTKPRGRGTGLGLAMVERVARAAGGALTVESELGAGSTVAVLLPVVAVAPDELGRDPERPASPRGDETVLVVDDDRLVLRFVRRALERLGYVVIATTSPVEALELAAERPEVAAAVLDVVMPTMGGPELAERLLQVRPGLPIRLVSAHAESAGGDLLRKPFTEDELARAVRAAIDGLR